MVKLAANFLLSFHRPIVIRRSLLHGWQKSLTVFQVCACLGRMPAIDDDVRQTLKRIQEELEKSGVQRDQNTIELVFAHFDSNSEQTVATLKGGNWEKIVGEWTAKRQKRQRARQSKTSSPFILARDISSETASSSTHCSLPKKFDERDAGSKQDQVSFKVYNELAAEIKRHEKSIEDYERRMEQCESTSLRDYYIQSALDTRDTIKTLRARQDAILNLNATLTERMDSLVVQVEKLMRRSDEFVKSKLDCWESGSNRTKDE